jgi:energy-coupling factor transporter ATP-binding protein EcfA2
MTDGPFDSFQDELDAQLAKTARFRRAAFHVHSIDSYDWGKDGDSSTNDRSKFEGEGQDAFLQQLIDAGLELVVITDHMRCAYACELAKRAEGRAGITVFPGMEVSCKADPGHGSRIHFLVAFPPGTTPDVIGRIFHGQEGLKGEADRDGTEEIVVRNMGDFAKAVNSAGGMLIFAHVDEQGRGHRSFVRRAIGETLEMLAIDPKGKETEVEISEMYKEFLVDAAPDAVEVRSSKDSEHYAEIGTADGRIHTIACVAQSDFHNVESFARKEAFTYLKVSRPEFGCVAEALKFRDTRVRFTNELPEAPTPRVIGLRLRSPGGEGLFEELTVAFNENLNCAIGARGCGKSTVVEALRYVLGQRSLLTEAGDGAESSFAALASATADANLAGTQIELIYDTGSERHVLAATYDAESECTTRSLTFDGADCHVAPEAIASAYPVLIFSWGELETLGREPRLQRVVVDRLSERLPELSDRLATSHSELAANRETCEAARSELERIGMEDGGLLHRYRELKAKFERMNKPEVAELYKNLDEARNRVRALEAFDGRLQDLLVSLGQIDPAAPAGAIADLSAGTLAWWEQEVQEEVDLRGLESDLIAGLEAMRTAVEGRRKTLAAKMEAERKRRDETEDELREKTQTDASTSIQGEQRETARRRFEEASALRERYVYAYAELTRLLSERASLLKAASEARGDIAATRKEVAAGLTAQLADIGSDGGPEVSIEVSEGADRTALEAFLSGGFLNPERAGQWKSQRIPQRLATRLPEQIAWAILDGDPTVLTATDDEGLGDEQAARLVSAVSPFAHDEDADVTLVDACLDELLKLQEQQVDDVVRIYSDGEPVDKLSPGGRSSAMLPLIALSDDAPLIIDQPEDNLDNRMVGDTLSKILAHLKERRQIIVTTHNPNIVVGGDAEQVIILKALGDRSARLEETGNIDEDAVIDAVIKIMEGGKEAFKERERRYGSHLS